jgi:RNA polymerase sigma-70 factor (ECF subfamily)
VGQPDAETLFQQLTAGDPEAAEALFPIVYEELHAAAHRLMARERDNHTLQTTALLHEAWVKIAGDHAADFQDRRHFLRLASRAMRNVLVDHARRRNAKKRQGARAQPLIEDALAYWEEHHHDLLALDEALERLGEHDAELLRVVELRFFGGLTLEETGAVLGLSVSRTHKAWTFARSWLRRQLERGTHDA